MREYLRQCQFFPCLQRCWAHLTVYKAKATPRCQSSLALEVHWSGFTLFPVVCFAPVCLNRWPKVLDLPSSEFLKLSDALDQIFSFVSQSKVRQMGLQKFPLYRTVLSSHLMMFVAILPLLQSSQSMESKIAHLTMSWEIMECKYLQQFYWPLEGDFDPLSFTSVVSVAHNLDYGWRNRLSQTVWVVLYDFMVSDRAFCLMKSQKLIWYLPRLECDDKYCFKFVGF